MTISKVFQRDLLGLLLIVLTALVALYVLLNIFALFAYVNNEDKIASTFLDQSFYLMVFVIPPYFLDRYLSSHHVIES
ncbi:D-fructose-6-phosphate amidotransferase [Aliivibrio sp. 1S165]|nr:D-fructose-6-phosphate amidotransferase [Aliivibrio sp. 1S165]OCH32893.1 D-fructose-6-phosphate amidotransferase [Aliivibrio sp. 1S175]